MRAFKRLKITINDAQCIEGDIKWMNIILYRYIMCGRGICEKYQSRDEIFPEPNSNDSFVLAYISKID